QFRNFHHGARRTAPSLARLGIHNPDVGDAEPKVIRNPLVGAGDTILGRENFDTDEWGIAEDLTGGLADNHAHVGHPEASRRHLNALLRDDANAPLLA